MDHDPTGLPVLMVDGARFDDFSGFTREFSRLLRHHTWNGNLDAFNDILRGGFGTPEGGWILRWTSSERSRAVLGYEATAARLEGLLLTCHPTNRERIGRDLARAVRREGPTLFDDIVSIIRDHGSGGDEAEGHVILQLV